MDTIEWDTIGKEDARAVEAVTEYEKVLQKSQKNRRGRAESAEKYERFENYRKIARM